MSNINRILCTMLLIGVAGGSLFGLMATFEPMDGAVQLKWRLMYGVVTGLSIIGMLRSNFGRAKGADGKHPR